MTECRFGFMNSKTMALKNAGVGVGGQIFLSNQEGVQKDGCSRNFCRCIGAKQSSKWNGNGTGPIPGQSTD
jgi:hypothetical protein